MKKIFKNTGLTAHAITACGSGCRSCGACTAQKLARPWRSLSGLVTKIRPKAATSASHAGRRRCRVRGPTPTRHTRGCHALRACGGDNQTKGRSGLVGSRACAEHVVGGCGQAAGRTRRGESRRRHRRDLRPRHGSAGRVRHRHGLRAHRAPRRGALD